MLAFSAKDHGRVANGEITVSFRLWKYAHVKAGKTYATGFGGRLAIDEVELLPAALIEDEELRLAGHKNRAEAMALAGEHTKSVVTPDTLLYRVRFHYIPDAEPVEKSNADVEAIVVKLEEMDHRSTHGPWTFETLTLIAEHPARRAGDLVTMMTGYDTLLSFKTDVRKLKALGLTISLEVGYRLSELGERVLAAR